MSVMFARHLVLRVLEITPAGNALMPCAWDNTQRASTKATAGAIPDQVCRDFFIFQIGSRPSCGLVLPGQLLQSSRELPTKVAVLAMDLDSGFGSFIHVLLAFMCVGVLRIAEHNKEFAEVTQAAFPQSVHLECVHKLGRKRSRKCSRADPSICCSSGEVRRVEATLSGAQM